MCEIVINELIEELFEENNRLLSELKFSSIFNTFLEKYRHLLLNIKCCLKSSDNQLLIESLEKDYKTIITDGCAAQQSLVTGLTHWRPFASQEVAVSDRTSKPVTREDGYIDGTNGQIMSDTEEVEELSHNDNNYDNNPELKNRRKTRGSFKTERPVVKEIIKCHHKDCTFETHLKYTLIEHQTQHPEVEEYVCSAPDCDKQFATKRLLRYHSLRHSTERPHRCDWAACEAAFKRKQQLECHRRTHEGVREYECPHDGCHKSFVNRSSLHSHLNTHRKPFECVWPACGQRFGDKRHLTSHVNEHQGIRPFRCPTPGCGKAFASKTTLDQHQRVVHNRNAGPKVGRKTDSKPKEFRCDYDDCLYATTSGQNLAKHQKRHRMDRRFVCPVADCAKRFVTRYDLKCHMISHSTERPFRCDWPACGAAFKVRPQLECHRRTHTGVREFVCPHVGCGKSFVTKSNVNSHLNSHKHPYACVWPECGQRFTTKARLTTHMNEHQGLRPYKCQFIGCEKCFYSNQYRNQHMKVVHKMRPQLK